MLSNSLLMLNNLISIVVRILLPPLSYRKYKLIEAGKFVPKKINSKKEALLYVA